MHRHESYLHSYGIPGLVRTGLLCLGALPLVGLVALIGIQTEDIATGAAGSLFPVAGLIALLALLSVGWLALLNLLPAVQTSAEGMKIRVFWFWWRSIAWDDVMGLYRWQTSGNRIVIVVVRRLTPLHLLFGMTYAEMLKPAFLISARIAGYDDLIRTIVSQTGKQLST